MKRRHFLQFAASALTMLGINTLAVQRQGLQYARVLAQPTPRKRALLVGVNTYNLPLRPLRGCVQDVEMQKELLIHRFGFLESDIHILTNESATRENILEAFEEHLIKACAPRDVAVFHFSGHGRRIADPTGVRVAGGERDPLNSTLVPFGEEGNREGEVSDIMGRSLFLLTSRLQTEQVTTVLDSCYAEGGIRGSVRVRSGGRSNALRPSRAELEAQVAWQRELELEDDALRDRRDMGIAKGIALAAARRNEQAVDVTFGTQDDQRFHAGAFSYFLTQYLWHEAEPVRRVISNVSRVMADEAFTQTPSACVAPFECVPDAPDSASPATYFVDSLETSEVPAAEGVLVEGQQNRGTVWLGGSDPYSLETYGVGAEFVAIAPDGRVLADSIRVRSRRGLFAEVDLPQSLPENTLLREASRVIPENYKLRVGIDPSLMESFGSLDAVFDLRTPRLEWVPFNTEAEPYAGEVQYILSRMTEDYPALFSAQGTEDMPPIGSFVVMSRGLEELIPGVSGEPGETLLSARDRIATKLNALLATRLIKLLVNATASPLKLQAEMQIVGRGAQQAQYFTARGSRNTQPTTPGSLLQIPVGQSIQFRILHQEPEPLYILVFSVGRNGEVFAIFPSSIVGVTTNETQLRPNRELRIPQPGKRPIIATDPGFGEVLVVASRAPLTNAFQALISNRGTANASVVDALINDLSAIDPTKAQQGDRTLRIAATEMAAMSIPFQIVANG